MKMLSILSIVILMTAGTTAYAGGDSPKVQCDSCPGQCVQIEDYYITDSPYYGEGYSYELHFKLSVDENSNFIRIHDGYSAGSTFSYPWHDEWQTMIYTTCCPGGGIELAFDLYDVLPNGKVMLCSNYDWFWLGGEGQGKDHNRSAGPTTRTVVTDMTVSPNPATDVARVQVLMPTNDPSSSVDIIDMNGVVVATVARNLAQGVSVLPADVANLPTGAYTVRMLHADGAVVTPLRIVR